MKHLIYSWRNRRKTRPRKGKIAAFFRTAAAVIGLPDSDWDLAALFTDDEHMERFNADIVGHVGTTDVITLCYFEADAPVLPGEVAIELYLNPDAAEREGKKRRRSDYATELARYMVHGLLHCAGFNDLNPQDRAKMRRQELSVLRQLAKRGMTPESLFRVD